MKKALLSLTVISLFTARIFAQMVVTSPVPPAALAAAITGGGVTISNVTTNGATSTSQGTFTSTGLGNIGIASGILITSGSASVAAALNTGTGQGAAINNLSDPQLTALTTGITRDASTLEFDFIAVSDTVIFNYVFGSDEYSDYVNSQFNDVFGFFISGPGIPTYQNIALIPGTTIPIAINNVNNGGPVGHGTPLPGPCTNCAYFLDNSVAPITFATAYDGLTTVLTAVAVNLQPGLTYHLKLAVSDVGDQIFDSGSFIEAGSFLTPAPPWLFVGGLHVTDDTLHICSGSSVQLSAPAGFSYLWSTGAATQAITVNTAGVYNVTVTGSNALMPVFSDPITFVVVTTSISQPVLSQNGNTLISSVTSPLYNYSWTLNGNPVSGIGSTLNASQAGCYAITVQYLGGCSVTSDTLCIGSVGIAENSSQSFHRISPNPFNQSGELVFENKSKENFTLKIFDLTGTEQRKDVNIISGSFSIEKQNLSAGIYFYDLRNESGTITYKGKFVIN